MPIIHIHTNFLQSDETSLIVLILHETYHGLTISLVGRNKKIWTKSSDGRHTSKKSQRDLINMKQSDYFVNLNTKIEHLMAMK